jgi:hypothetical protein
MRAYLTQVSPNREQMKLFVFQVTLVLLQHNGIMSTPNMHQFCILYQMLHWHQNGFRQAKNLMMLSYLKQFLASLGGSQAVLTPFGGSVQRKFFLYTLPRNLNIYPISSLLIKMYYFVSTFIDSSGA